MKKYLRSLPLLLLGITLGLSSPLHAQRKMEALGRGVVAVRASGSSVFVSWRLFGKDPSGIGFNLYRSANGGAAVKLNGAVLTAGTNYTDTTANLTQSNAYSVKPVIGGVEQAASGSFTLTANHATEPIVRVPIRTPASGYYTKCVWVGDLDGDGEYDYVIDRLAPFDPDNNDIGLGNQFVEAYKRDGTRLWVIDMGPSSRGTYNISPGAATISMGMYDGVTVGDLNNDGKAEVVLKVADGVKFADGTVFDNPDINRQFIAIINGETGNLLAAKAFPTDFYSQSGKFGTQLGIGSINGVSPAIFGWLRNRNADKSFNDIYVAWSWAGGNITENWKYPIHSPGGAGNVEASHQMRIVDVNGDGTDEFTTGNVCINSNGTLRYIVPGAVHGDRTHIGKFDPTRAGLQGYYIQQNNPSFLLECYYDATNGTVLWQHFGSTLTDVGRGAAGDIDPGGSTGYEVWSFQGVYTARNNTQIASPSSNYPWPNIRIWWDGDTLSEDCDNTTINKFDPATDNTGRLVSGYQFGGTSANHVPMIVGDIMGDWREEMVLMNTAYSELMIFTTNIPSTTRIYTLPHNPYYRNCLTVKGYYQSNHVDYYLGNAMATPPVPNITYPGDGGAPSAPIANGTYSIQNRANGKMLDNLGVFANGSPIGQWSDGSSNNQKWVVTVQSSGYYKLSCVTGGAFMDSLGNTADGDPVGQWAGSSSTNQQWSIVATGSYFKIINRATGKALDNGAQTVNGDPMELWTSGGSTNQQWSFVTP